jgi:hypothetical protein
MKNRLILTSIVILAMSAPCFAQAEKNQTAKPAATAAPKSTSAKSALIDGEKAAWDAFRNKQEAGMRNWCAKDYTGVYAEGLTNVKGEVADMAKWKFENVSFADWKVTFPDKDMAVMTYKVMIKGIHDGKDASGTYNASTALVNRGGKWMAVLHTETKAQ